MAPSHHKVRRTAQSLAYRGAIGPKDGMYTKMPVVAIALRRLEQSIANVEVRSLDYTVRLRIVTGDANMMEMIFFGQVGCRGDPRRTIIGNDF